MASALIVAQAGKAFDKIHDLVNNYRMTNLKVLSERDASKAFATSKPSSDKSRSAPLIFSRSIVGSRPALAEYFP